MKFSIFLVVLLLLVAVFAPLLTPFPASGRIAESTSEALAMAHTPPSFDHPLGTDAQGRDVFARTVFGARVSLSIGIISRLIAVVFGGVVGALAGYFGGKVDYIFSRGIEVILAFPSLILAIAIGVTLGPGLMTVAIAIIVVSWVDVAILIRALAVGIERKDYITAARALGDHPLRILVRQVIPNCFPTLLVAFSFGIASAIMVEASLSFLGIGVSSGSVNMPSWGWMIYAEQGNVGFAPWAVFGPGVMLALTVLGWNMLGDNLRDRLDVKAGSTT